MATTQQVAQGAEFDLRRSLLDLLWKIGLVGGTFAGIAVFSSTALGWRWAAMPVLWILSSLLVWQSLERDWYAVAAWSYVLVTAAAVFVPLALAADPAQGAENVTLRVLVQGLPFANLILIFLAGILLPAWSTLLMLGIDSAFSISGS